MSLDITTVMAAEISEPEHRVQTLITTVTAKPRTQPGLREGDHDHRLSLGGGNRRARATARTTTPRTSHCREIAPPGPARARREA
eukprot:15441137-Alexandrium_andersonii.AAC.1